MAKPLPTLDEEKEVFLKDKEFIEYICSSDQVWKRNDYCVTYDIWEHMLDLIYTGHPEEAWKFLDRVWKSDEKTKQAFLFDFKEQLSTSQYADQLVF